MRAYVGPAILLAIALLNILSVALTARPGWLSSRSPEQQKAVRAQLESRWFAALFVGVGGYCAVAATIAALRGRPAWWLWALAAVADLVSLAIRRQAAARLRGGAPAPEEPAVERRRRHRVTGLVAVSAVGVFASSGLGRAAEGSGNDATVILAVVLMVAALAGFVAAGWAAVWVTRERTD